MVIPALPPALNSSLNEQHFSCSLVNPPLYLVAGTKLVPSPVVPAERVFAADRSRGSPEHKTPLSALRGSSVLSKRLWGPQSPEGQCQVCGALWAAAAATAL